MIIRVMTIAVYAFIQNLQGTDLQICASISLAVVNISKLVVTLSHFLPIYHQPVYVARQWERT